MLTPREKNPLYRKMSPEEDRTRDGVDCEPKHYQRAIPAPTVTRCDEKFGLHSLSQCDSTYTCLSRSVPKVQYVCCLEIKQAIKPQIIVSLRVWVSVFVCALLPYIYSILF